LLKPSLGRRHRIAVLAAGVTVVALAISTGSTAVASLPSPVSHGVTPAVIGVGPAGGLTPADLAVAYGFTPISRKSQVVAVVSWFDDPHIRADVKKFDDEYSIPLETSASLRVVNQDGKKSPLPSASKGKQTSHQTVTEVETVRGVCQTCRILLVEAKSGSVSNAATAERAAGRLGATEIVNTLASPETKQPSSVLHAFDQPGVVITAPAGDGGWYGMDAAFGSGTSPGRPSFPATAPGVVAVGGTSLELNNNATIFDQTVWNADGPDGSKGINEGASLGATGGGCSKRYSAPKWQRAVAGYAATGCAGKRLAVDVSADGDPATGLDVYDTWGNTGWLTTGGDGLAAALVGGMYALAGGAADAADPAAAVYENAARHPTAVFDVVDGGNGFCGGDTTSSCGANVFTDSGSVTHNPNALGGGIVDCSFPRNNSDPASSPPLSTECNATAGFDGPSGVGTPFSTSLFSPTNPGVKIHHSGVRAGTAATFRLAVHVRLSGTKVKKVTVAWGDGHTSRGTSIHQRHTYRKAGKVHVTVSVTDNLGQATIVHSTLTVKKPRH
jgi:hypothetical protein